MRHRMEVIKAQKAVAMFLLKNRFDPGNVNSKRGWLQTTTPLHEAVKQNDAYITSKLLMFGADLESRDLWGRTAYHYVGSEQLQVKEILEHYDARRLSPHPPELGRCSLLTCPPPQGFEEFFAQVEMDPLVQVPSCEATWLLIRGPHRCAFATES